MAIKIIRDLNEGHANDTANWLPAIFSLRRMDGGTDYCVAWGSSYALLSSGLATALPEDSESTDENGNKTFATREKAENYLDSVEEALSY